jgi:signal transduction histidine kinase
MAASRSPLRRRQRSARVTASVSLLSVATVAVLVSLPTRSPLWLSLASILAAVLAWGAVRLMWTEVLQSRRENAADRAAAAAAYRNLFAIRVAEHDTFAAAMTERLALAHISQRHLEGLIVQHETRAQRAETKLAAEQDRVRELEQALAALQDGDVVDLVAWDEQVQKAGQQKAAQKRARTLKQA